MRKLHILLAIPLLLLGYATPVAPPPQDRATGVLVARWHPSGFEHGDDNYNAVFAASDGKIYYVISAHHIDIGAQMYSYDPAAGQVKHLGDLTEASGEKGLKAVPQGKSHVGFFEHAGKLYFATHLGYYNTQGGKEMVGIPPPGYRPYPGGHFLACDLATGAFQKLASAPSGEGIISMTMDPKRGRLYGLTWPSAMFLSYDLASRELRNWGMVSGQGEKGAGSSFRVVCRSLALAPPTGAVYFTLATGEILRYDYQRNTLDKLAACTMKRPIFGSWDPDRPGHMAYNWRQTVWHDAEQAVYGTHGGTGQLFRFDPRAQQIDVIDRIASSKTRAGGFYDAFSYGYLGLTLGPDKQTLYFLTGTPDGEEIRLVTYHLPTRGYVDHGAIALDDGRRPTWAQAIAVGRDRRIYTVSKMREGSSVRTDLLSFPDPLQSPPAPAPVPKLVRSWGADPQMPVPLKEVHACGFDRDGNVLAVDSIGSRVQRFTPLGKWLGEIGTGPGSGPGQFNAPRDAKTSRSGEIFVSDGGNFRIQVFSHDGKFLRLFGEKGTGPGQFLRAHALDFAPDGRLYVVDVDNNRVSVFETSGRFLFAFGRKGVRAGEFRDAHGLGIAPNGDVYVSSYYGPVQKFSPDGRFLFEFAAAGFRGWVHFHSMGTDGAGNVYLAARNARHGNAVVMYDQRGAYVTSWSVREAGRELGVRSVAVDRAGLIHVAVDSPTRHGVSVYSLPGVRTK